MKERELSFIENVYLEFCQYKLRRKKNKTNTQSLVKTEEKL